MADRIRVFPLVVLAGVVILGLIFYWASRKRETGPIEKPKPPEPASAAGDPPATAPMDPGAKILQGADRAYKTGFYETALSFYKDFDLRYAGTSTYDSHAIRVWEKIPECAHAMGKSDPALDEYVKTRRLLHEEWKRLKGLLASGPADAIKGDLQKYLDSLPPRDGRRPQVEAWLGGAPRDEKK